MNNSPVLAENLRSVSLTIRGMTCAACQMHVQRALGSVAGVAQASVNLMGHTAQVRTAETVSNESLLAAVRASGYEASVAGAVPAPGKTRRDAALMNMDGERLGLRTVCALAAGAVAMTLSMAPMMAVASSPGWSLRTAWLLCALAILVMVFAAPEIYSAAWRAARHGATNMNTLVALGTLSAFGASVAGILHLGPFREVYFEAVILILAFLLTGRWLEARARDRATAALGSFAELEPTDARLLSVAVGTTDFSAAKDTLMPLAAIERGDLLRVLPGDRIPLDGKIVAGRSLVDEAMLTGEPLPISRSVGEQVAGGTVNLDGVLVIQATTIGSDSTLAQMQRLLSEAQSSRAPLQRIADRASAIFVPTVLCLSALAFTIWLLFGVEPIEDRLGRALSIAIAILIISCPCAMGLAVPAAMTVAVGAAARAGLLIKGGEALERLATVDTIALDKTGTLTSGQPKIVALRMHPDSSFDTTELLQAVAAAERFSTHPLARAVVRYAEAEGVGQGTITALESVAGVGLRFNAFLGGVSHAVAVGNASMLDGAPLSTLGNGLLTATPLYVVIAGRLQAALYAQDEVRPSAAEAILQLKTLGVRPVLLTGDTAPSAEEVARATAIEEVHASLLPAQKLAAVRALQAAGHRVAMAGDGLNDAAALAQSDAGIAMAAGSDLARQAGDVLLLHNDLLLLPAAIRIARRTVRVMRENLGWAVLYNAVGIPLAAGVLYPHFHLLLSPIVASAAMALSSVSVLANSLRLRRVQQ